MPPTGLDFYAILFQYLPTIVIALLVLVLMYFTVRKAVRDELNKSGR